MEETAPSNAVLEAKLDSLSATILANNTTNHEAHNMIIAQTTKTNGRVTALEKTKWLMTGAFFFINLFILPIAVAMILRFLKF